MNSRFHTICLHLIGILTIASVFAVQSNQVEQEGEIARAFALMGQYEKALHVYQNLLKSPIAEQQKQIVYYNLGTVLLLKGQYQDSLKALKQIENSQDPIAFIYYNVLINKGICILKMVHSIAEGISQTLLQTKPSSQEFLKERLRDARALLKQFHSQIHQVISDLGSSQDKLPDITSFLQRFIGLDTESIVLLKRIDQLEIQSEVSTLNSAEKFLRAAANAHQAKCDGIDYILSSQHLPSSEDVLNYTKSYRDTINLILQNFSSLCVPQELFASTEWAEIAEQAELSILDRSWKESAYDSSWDVVLKWYNFELNLLIYVHLLAKQSVWNLLIDQEMAQAELSILMKDSLELSEFYRKTFDISRRTLIRALEEREKFLEKSSHQDRIQAAMIRSFLNENEVKDDQLLLQAIEDSLSVSLMDKEENKLLYFILSYLKEPALLTSSYLRPVVEYLKAKDITSSEGGTVIFNSLNILKRRLEHHAQNLSERDSQENNKAERIEEISKTIQKMVDLRHNFFESDLNARTQLLFDIGQELETTWLQWNPKGLLLFKLDLINCALKNAQLWPPEKSCKPMILYVLNQLNIFSNLPQQQVFLTESQLKDLKQLERLLALVNQVKTTCEEEKAILSMTHAYLQKLHWSWWERNTASNRDEIQTALELQRTVKFALKQGFLIWASRASSSGHEEPMFILLESQDCVDEIARCLIGRSGMDRLQTESLEQIIHLSDAVDARIKKSPNYSSDIFTFQDKIIQLLQDLLQSRSEQIPQQLNKGYDTTPSSLKSTDLQEESQDKPQRGVRVRPEDAIRLLQQMEKEDRQLIEDPHPKYKGVELW